MNPHRPDSHSNTAMQRIATLLFALADLAERAAGRSAAVRILILRPVTACLDVLHEACEASRHLLAPAHLDN